MNTGKKLYRSRTNRMLAGVCGGLGEYLNMDPTVVRLLFVLLTAITSFAPGVIVYIIMMFFVPEDPSGVIPPSGPSI